MARHAEWVDPSITLSPCPREVGEESELPRGAFRRYSAVGSVAMGKKNDAGFEPASGGRPLPAPCSESVSRRMSRVRTTGTGPELRLRAVLYALGHRYRLNHRPVVGLRCYPDLVFIRPKVAVFVDGCFWHGCPDHPSWPKSNAAWWRGKIARNRSRDVNLTSRLTQAGWLVIRLWEHQAADEAASIVQTALRERTVRWSETEMPGLIDAGR